MFDVIELSERTAAFATYLGRHEQKFLLSMCVGDSFGESHLLTLDGFLVTNMYTYCADILLSV